MAGSLKGCCRTRGWNPCRPAFSKITSTSCFGRRTIAVTTRQFFFLYCRTTCAGSNASVEGFVVGWLTKQFHTLARRRRRTHRKIPSPPAVVGKRSISIHGPVTSQRRCATLPSIGCELGAPSRSAFPREARPADTRRDRPAALW